jgi:hypothetical protein
MRFPQTLKLYYTGAFTFSLLDLQCRAPHHIRLSTVSPETIPLLLDIRNDLEQLMCPRDVQSRHLDSSFSLPHSHWETQTRHDTPLSLTLLCLHYRVEMRLKREHLGKYSAKYCPNMCCHYFPTALILSPL